MMFLIMPDLPTAEALVVRLNDWFGYPNPETATDNYTLPLPHPNAPEDGRYLMILLNNALGEEGPLTEDERAALIDLEGVIEEGWG